MDPHSLLAIRASMVGHDGLSQMCIVMQVKVGAFDGRHLQHAASRNDRYDLNVMQDGSEVCPEDQGSCGQAGC